MTFKLNKNDRRLLATIAEHRVLTTSQVTAIQHKSRQVVGGVSDNWKRQGSLSHLPEDWVIAGADPKKWYP